MTTRLTQARQKARTLATKMTAIVDNPHLSDADKLRQLDDYQPDLDAAQAEVKSLEGVARRRKQIFGTTHPGDNRPGQWDTPTGAAAVAPLVLPAHALKSLHEAAVQHRSLKIAVDLPDVGAKGPNQPEDWSGSYMPAQLMPTLTSLAESTRTASLFPTTSMTGPSVEYVRVTGHNGSAAVVAPGELKPSIGLVSEKIEAKAVKIAGICSVEDESLEDFPDFAQVVSIEIQNAVIDAENAELLAGDGTTGHMAGLLSTSGIQARTTLAGDTAADTIEQAITDLRTGSSYTGADAVIFHPDDWSAVRRLKDSTGRYVVDPDPTTAGALSLWGVPVKLTTALPVGTAIVGAFALGGVLHVRRGLTVETNYNGDDWARNKTTFRAELREVLAVKRPSAFVQVDLTP